MKFNEIITLESFDLSNTLPYTKLTPKTTIEYLTPVYIKLYPQLKLEQITMTLRHSKIQSGYLIKSEDDILLFVIDKDDHIEYHFSNISQLSSEGKTNSLGKSSINVFATIVKIILDNLNKAKDIHILVEPNKYKLYKNIINKVLNQYANDWEITGEIDNQLYKVIVLSSNKTYLGERLFR